MQVTCTGSSPEGTRLGGRKARFAHPSERRFARILDFYRLRWEYEPHTFPLVWDPSGRATESFTPDFWLPDLGVYLELTTLRQCLVTRKNGKVRRFRLLYPDRRVHLLYRSDLEKLALKFAARRPTLRAA